MAKFVLVVLVLVVLVVLVLVVPMLAVPVGPKAAVILEPSLHT